MLETPAATLAIARAVQDHILALLRSRFGPVPDDIFLASRRVMDRRKLKGLHNLAVFCPTLDIFRAALQSGPGPHLGGQVTLLEEEQGFLLGLKASPDDVTALVYADWLEDRNEPAASEFLRLHVGLGQASDTSTLEAIVARLRRLSPALNGDWMVRCINLLARRPLLFRVLEAHTEDAQERTVLHGVLQSGRVRRGDGVLVPCQRGEVAGKYVSHLADGNKEHRTCSAGQCPLEFDLIVRDQLVGVCPGVTVVAWVEGNLERSRLLDQDVEALGLSARGRAWAARMGCRTIRDVTSLAPEDILEFMGFGETTLLELRDRLATLDLELGMTR